MTSNPHLLNGSLNKSSMIPNYMKQNPLSYQTINYNKTNINMNGQPNLNSQLNMNGQTFNRNPNVSSYQSLPNSNNNPQVNGYNYQNPIK